jgi:hypothetical protein
MAATRPLHSSQAEGAVKGPQKEAEKRGTPVGRMPVAPAWRSAHAGAGRKDELSGILVVNTRNQGEELPRGRDENSRRIVLGTFDEVIVAIETGDEEKVVGALRSVHKLVEYLNRKDLWDIMESLATAALDMKREAGLRAACIDKMVYLHGEIAKKAVAEGRGGTRILVGSAKSEGLAGSEIPPVQFRAGKEGASLERPMSQEDEMLMSEKAMAAAILGIWGGSEDRRLVGAAERAIVEIDSPILRVMLNAAKEVSKESGLEGLDMDVALSLYLDGMEKKTG